jgi:hypothetical protein
LLRARVSFYGERVRAAVPFADRMRAQAYRVQRWGGSCASIAVGSALIAAIRPARGQEANLPDASPAIRVSPGAAAATWTLTQLVPSPLYVASSNRVGGGVRWQITPFVYSFGVAAKPVRFFVVDPVARHSGGVELYFSPEWACCTPHAGTSWIARAGGRLYWPLVGRGEALAGSVGGSYYRASDGGGGSVEIGLYTLFSMIGLTATVSPRLTGREVITALQIRYF